MKMVQKCGKEHLRQCSKLKPGVGPSELHGLLETPSPPPQYMALGSSLRPLEGFVFSCCQALAHTLSQAWNILPCLLLDSYNQFLFFILGFAANSSLTLQTW